MSQDTTYATMALMTFDRTVLSAQIMGAPLPALIAEQRAMMTDLAPDEDAATAFENALDDYLPDLLEGIEGAQAAADQQARAQSRTQIEGELFALAEALGQTLRDPAPGEAETQDAYEATVEPIAATEFRALERQLALTQDFLGLEPSEMTDTRALTYAHFALGARGTAPARLSRTLADASHVLTQALPAAERGEQSDQAEASAMAAWQQLILGREQARENVETEELIDMLESGEHVLEIKQFLTDLDPSPQRAEALKVYFEELVNRAEISADTQSQLDAVSSLLPIALAERLADAMTTALAEGATLDVAHSLLAAIAEGSVPPNISDPSQQRAAHILMLSMLSDNAFLVSPGPVQAMGLNTLINGFRGLWPQLAQWLKLQWQDPGQDPLFLTALAQNLFVADPNEDLSRAAFVGLELLDLETSAGLRLLGNFPLAEGEMAPAADALTQIRTLLSPSPEVLIERSKAADAMKLGSELRDAYILTGDISLAGQLTNQAPLAPTAPQPLDQTALT